MSSLIAANPVLAKQKKSLKFFIAFTSRGKSAAKINYGIALAHLRKNLALLLQTKFCDYFR